jgi:site-specific recombinase XerD
MAPTGAGLSVAGLAGPAQAADAGGIDAGGRSGGLAGAGGGDPSCPVAGAAAKLDEAARDALRRFDQVMANAGRAANTRRLYGSVVARWLAFGGRPGHLDPALAARWLCERRRAGCAAATLNLDIKAMRAFYRAMHVLGLTAATESAKAPRQRREPQRLVRAYTAAEVQILLDAPPADTWTGARDRLLLRTLWETGLRGGELARLSIGDVLREGFVFVGAAKGGRDRYVPIGAPLHAALLAWIGGRRREARPGKRTVLFVRQNGRGLAGAGAVWRIVSRYAQRALGTPCGFSRVRGARKPWSAHSPHVLRASIATALHAHGMPVTAVAELLGHASLDSTARYVAVDVEGLRAAVHSNPRLRRRG